MSLAAESASPELRWQLIRASELPAYLASAAYRLGPVVPLSPHRAESQLRNPHLLPDDAVLLLVCHAERLVGYLGCMAGVLWRGDQSERCGVLTCLWVDPVYRGQRIAQRLFEQMLEAWSQRAFLTEYAAASRPIYERLGRFDFWAGEGGMRGYLRPNLADLLPPRGGWWPRLRPLLRVADALLHPLNVVRLAVFHFKKIKKAPDVTYLAALDDATADFVATQARQHDGPRRGRAELDWALAHPWVLGEPTEFDPKRFYFTSFAPDFRQWAAKMCDAEGRVCAFWWATLRDRHLKIRYCYATDLATEAVTDAVLALALRHDVAMLTVQWPPLAAVLLARGGPFFFKKKFAQPFVVSKGCGDATSFRFQSGDADAVFT
jgi:GNAT superfamily N-acetyltransferase